MLSLSICRAESGFRTVGSGAERYHVYRRGRRKAYEEILVPAGMDDDGDLHGAGPLYAGALRRAGDEGAIHEIHHKEYVGVDACAVNLMRPAMYGRITM